MIREEVRSFPDVYDDNLRLISKAYTVRLLWARIATTKTWIVIHSEKLEPGK